MKKAKVDVYGFNISEELAVRPQGTTSVRYRELRDPDEIKSLMEKWKIQNAR